MQVRLNPLLVGLLQSSSCSECITVPVVKVMISVSFVMEGLQLVLVLRKKIAGRNSSPLPGHPLSLLSRIHAPVENVVQWSGVQE